MSTTPTNRPDTTPHSTPTQAETPSDDIIAKERAEWLHRHDAPKDWLIVTKDEVATLKRELARFREESAALVEGSHESLPMQGVAAVATGSPAVIEAEPFLDWLTERIIELQRGREAAHQSGDYATAERRKNYAAVYETVKFKLQRQMERATVRQPQENMKSSQPGI